MMPDQDVSPHLLPMGDGAWTVEFGTRIDPHIHARVMGFVEALAAARLQDPILAVIRDVVPTFRSVTVHVDPLAVDHTALAGRLQALADTAQPGVVSGRHWRLPVCFDDEFAPDLASLAERSGLGRQGVIDLLCTTEFRVYLIGFMPGFPYMGGLPEVLQVPRLATPRKAVPARSLAVAGEMCAVYPWESPGGWNLLGRTPLPLFTADEARPALLASGDRVRWQPIDRAAYEELECALRDGRTPREAFLEPGA